MRLEDGRLPEKHLAASLRLGEIVVIGTIPRAPFNRVPVNESDARCFILIRALEERDVEGRVIPLAIRKSATREAGPPEKPSEDPADPVNDAFLARRARLIGERLRATHPELAQLTQPVSWRPWLLAVGVMLSGIAGFSAAEIGPAQRLHLLSFPLLGLIAWNIGFYLLMAVAWARNRRRNSRSAAAADPAWFRGWVRLRHRTRSMDGPEGPAVAAFAEAWTRRVAPLRGIEIRQGMHLMAAMLAAGLIAGLYLRGLVLEYRAGWESTFMDAGTLETVLHVVFGPASWLTGIALPDAEGLRSLEWGFGGNGANAAPWIHLAAVTAGLFIIGPRLVLAIGAGRRARRLRANLPVYVIDGYTRPLLHAATGAGERGVVIPLGYEPGEGTLAVVRELVMALLGGQGRMDVMPAVSYGTEEERAAALPGELNPPPAWLITLINLAVTPEAEIHGDWLQGLRKLVETGAVNRVLLLADGTALRTSLPPGAADQREAERLKAWQALAGFHAFSLVLIGPDDERRGDLATEARRHAQTRGSTR